MKRAIKWGIALLAAYMSRTERSESLTDYLNSRGFAGMTGETGRSMVLRPFTRDTFGVAIKAVYAEFKEDDGTIIKMPVYKDPKTDRENGGGNFKKSQHGCCLVYKTADGEYHYQDGYTWDELENIVNQELKTVFKDGKLVKEETLSEIRARLNDNKF